MITIREIREKYPQYKDMSDYQIADSLHEKHYRDIPKNDFYQKIGLSNNENVQSENKNNGLFGGIGEYLGESAKGAPNALLNAIIGAGDAAVNLPINLHNLITPKGMNVNPIDRDLGQGYGLGKVAGDVGSFIAGGAPAEGARLAAEGIPYLGKAAEALGGEQGLSGIARRALGSAGYGAVQNPEERGTSALESGGLSALLDTLGGAGKIGKKIPEAISYLNPEKYSKGIENLIKSAKENKDRLMEILGGGKSLEQNKKGLAKDIKNAYEMRKKEASEIYNPIFEELGESRVPYNEYKGISDSAIKEYDRDLNKMHNKFILNPTVENAHKLQSQLGSATRDLQNLDSSGKLTLSDRNAMQLYRDAQSSLRDDIDKFLSSKSPDIADRYKFATQNYAENVVPYTSSTNLSKISKGNITNPSTNALVNLFKNPQEGTNNTISKIVNDLGPDARKRILFSELGKYSQSETPESLLANISRLDEKGLGEYATHHVKKTHENLKNIYDEINKLKYLDEESKKGLGGLVKGTVGKFIPSSLFEIGNRTKSDNISPLYELAKKLLISSI
jgi:hypothetical protein